MDCSANEREGGCDEIIKYGSLGGAKGEQRLAFDGLKQAQPVAHGKASGVSKVVGNLRHKQRERRLSISDRYVDQLEFPKVSKEGRECVILV
jgi:hypothetical protein